MVNIGSGLRAPTVIVLMALWLLACGLMIAARYFGHTHLDGYGQMGALVFILVLIVYLWLRPPTPSSLAAFPPIALPGTGFGQMFALVLCVLALLFALGAIAHPWIVLVSALTLIACWVTFRERQNLTRRLVVLALIAGALCLLLSGASGRLDGYQGFYLACVPILFTGGALLLDRTGLTRVHSVDGNWALAAKGFLWACVLALPAALLNVSYGAHAGDVWVDQFWEPTVALVPGIAEETWARLFMLSLLYALLRPQSDQKPGRALLAAVLISAIAHGLAHLPAAMLFGPAAVQMFLAALLFGVPMALIFVRYGFEHAVGYHFFIDFVRFAVALASGP